MRLDGQTVVVTGASRGLGRAIALAMAEAGANVVLAARDEQALNAVAREVEWLGSTALAVPCDVREPASISRLAEHTLAKAPQVDTLVNSAGVGPRRLVTELAVAEWDDVFNTLVRGTLLATQAFLPGMIARKRGNIINLVAPLERTELPGFAAYAAANYAVVGLTRTLAQELRSYGINVNGLHPNDFTNTRLARNLTTTPVLSDSARLLDPSIITPAVVALAAQPPDGLTGAILDAVAWNTDTGLGAGMG